MQQHWRVSGAYAKWTLTLTIDPPEDTVDSDEPILTEWPSNRAERLAQYFWELVNCHENAMEIDNHHGRCVGHVHVS